jgi:hypothetical protein
MATTRISFSDIYGLGKNCHYSTTASPIQTSRGLNLPGVLVEGAVNVHDGHETGPSTYKLYVSTRTVLYLATNLQFESLPPEGKRMC